MNEFEYINHKIQDIIGNAGNFHLFHNDYRFDKDLDIIREVYFGPGINNQVEKKDAYVTRRRVKLKKVSFSKDIPHLVSYINHSYEPVYTHLDRDFFDTIVDHNRVNFPFTKYILHSEKDSQDIQYLQAQTGLGLIHWFANGYLCAEHWYRLYKDIRVVTEYQPIQHKFVCANRLMDELRSYRIKFLNMLDVSQGQYSLLEQDPNTLRTPWEIYPDNQVEPQSFDKHDNSSAWISLRINNDDKEEFAPSVWKSSFLHVVPETVVDRVHLTEKIFKPIVLKQPFVLLNGAGGLEYLRSYGFKTFSDFWSEEYDTIDDLDQRLQSAADVVNYVGSCSLKELEQMRDKMKPILEHNYNWFYNGFADKCWQELETNIKETL